MSEQDFNKLRELAKESLDDGDTTNPNTSPPGPSPSVSDILVTGPVVNGREEPKTNEFDRFNAEDKDGNRKRARKLKARLKREEREPDEIESRWLKLYQEANPRGRPQEDSPPPPPLVIDMTTGGKKEEPPKQPEPDPWAGLFDFDQISMKFSIAWGEHTKAIASDVRSLGGMAIPDEAIDAFVVPMTKLSIDMYLVPVVKMIFTDPKKAAPIVAISPALIMYTEKLVLKWRANKEAEFQRNPEPPIEQPPEEKKPKEEPKPRSVVEVNPFMKGGI